MKDRCFCVRLPCKSIPIGLKVDGDRRRATGVHGTGAGAGTDTGAGTGTGTGPATGTATGTSARAHAHTHTPAHTRRQPHPPTHTSRCTGCYCYTGKQPSRVLRQRCAAQHGCCSCSCSAHGRSASRPTGAPAWGPGLRPSSPPILPNVTVVTGVNVYNATVASGTYSHAPMISYHGGVLLVSWKNHNSSEDSPGQWVRWAWSSDGGARERATT